MIYDIVEGSSNNIQFQLLESGTAINLTGFTVTLLLDNRAGIAVAAPGTVTIIDAVNGKVQLAPTNTAVFVATAGPYYARWKIVDGSGKVSFVPSSTRDTWNIIGQ